MANIDEYAYHPINPLYCSKCGNILQTDAIKKAWYRESMPGFILRCKNSACKNFDVKFHAPFMMVALTKV